MFYNTISSIFIKNYFLKFKIYTMPSPVRPQRSAPSIAPTKKSRYVDDDDDDFIEDEPVVPRKRRVSPPPKKSPSYDTDEDDTPKHKPKRKVVAEDDSDEEEQEEEVTPPKRRTSGWGGVKEAKEAAANLYEGVPNDFWLLSGEETYIQFLDDAPICYDAHTVFIDGKRKTLPCQKEHKATCLMCNDGIKSQFVAAMRVLDFRGSWDKDAKRGKGEFKYDKPVEKVWRMSKGVAIQLEEYKTKRGIVLGKTVLLVSKSGENKLTRWNIERGIDDEDNPVKPIKHTSTTSSLEDVVIKVSDKYLIANHFENGGY